MTRSTFRLLFYVNGSKEKNGIVPIMGRVTINGTVAQFSCKRSIAKELWDAKGNRVKGKSREARETNLTLDNIKAQIIKHYQRISDREAYVTAEMVRNAYQGIGCPVGKAMLAKRKASAVALVRQQHFMQIVACQYARAFTQPKSARRSATFRFFGLFLVCSA